MFFRMRNHVKAIADAQLQQPVEHIGLGNPVDPAAERDVTSENLPRRDRIIFIVRKPPCEAGLTATIVEICHKTGCVIPVGTQKLGDGWVRCIERLEPVGTQFMSPPPGEHAAMRCESPWSRRESAIEPNALACQPIEVRRRQAPVSIKTQIIGPYRVPDDQQHVPAGRRGGRQQRFHLVFRPHSFAEPYQDEAE